jgi:CRP/FNR family transcriptional regulator, cyclic AMP receptor protein
VVTAAQLKSVPIFDGLSKKELKRIADCALEIDAVEGDQLLREGRFAFEFMIIDKGGAEVVRDGKRIADLGPGDVVGEIGALSHGQRTATVVAKAKTRVIYIRAQDFRRITADVPALGERIHRLVEERTQALTE